MPKKIKKRLDEICDFIPENHTYTKSYINEHKGEYPVYSATLGEPYGAIDTYDFERIDVLVVVNYGSSGNTYIIENEKFSIGRNICGLYIKDEYKNQISLEYVRIVATPLLIKRAKGEKQKNLNQNMVKETTILLPIDDNGIFDYDMQVELAEIYKEIDNQKRVLIEKQNEMKNVIVSIEMDKSISLKKVKLNDLFTPKGGKMKYSKKWCNEHKGDYAIYSGSTRDVFAYVESVEYDGDYLTWVIDGLAGYIKRITGKFDITCHRGILIPKDGVDNIDLDYIRFILQPIFRQKKRGRIGIDDKNEYTALKPTHIINYDIEIPIPVKEDGEYDLEAQTIIANKYKTIEFIKESIVSRIECLVDISIE